MMAKAIPFGRNSQATRGLRAKTLLLPMSRASADSLALQVHLALDALRRGHGNVHAAQPVTQAMILCGLLAGSGYGLATFEQMQDAERAISTAFDRDRDTGIWMLDEDGFAQFAIIASTYDYQMQRAPLFAIAAASDGLDRFQAGESFEQVSRRCA